MFSYGNCKMARQTEPLAKIIEKHILQYFIPLA